MVRTGRHQFYPQTFFEYWSVLDTEAQRNVLSVLKKSGGNIMTCTAMSRGGSSMSVVSHVEVIEKLGCFLHLKEMNNPPI